MNRRKTALILGMAGGLLGLIFTPLFTLVGILFGAVTGELQLLRYSVGITLLFIFGLVGVSFFAFIKTKPKLGGMIMLISGIVSLFWTSRLIIVIRVLTQDASGFIDVFPLLLSIVAGVILLVVAGVIIVVTDSINR
jgi:hypothetical protein